jgi:hypothetical protein
VLAGTGGELDLFVDSSGFNGFDGSGVGSGVTVVVASTAGLDLFVDLSRFD